jgi:hypothetical protein
MNNHEQPWTAMNTHEHPWTFVNNHEQPWTPVNRASDRAEKLMNSHEQPWTISGTLSKSRVGGTKHCVIFVHYGLSYLSSSDSSKSSIAFYLSTQLSASVKQTSQCCKQWDMRKWLLPWVHRWHRLCLVGLALSWRRPGSDVVCFNHI